MSVRILIGDCREKLRELPDASVDSCVCDPPYHLTSIVKRFSKAKPRNHMHDKHKGDIKAGQYSRLSKGFMGQSWDGGDVAFREETWAEVLRVLRPGGHLIAFSGTRTYHRMVCAIEDAGFEIRDQLAWVYGSGFPKSLDVSKAIEATLTKGGSSTVAMRQAAMGDQYEQYAGAGHFRDGTTRAKNAPNPKGAAFTATTEAAQQWQGWGTALKPSVEPVCLARKPYTNEQEWVTIRALVEGIWSALWLIFPANAADLSSPLNPRGCGVDPHASAQWGVEQLLSIQDALSVQMGTSRYASALASSLNTASSWNATLADLCRAESMSTIGTASSTTIDLRTLRFCLSRITPESIILAHRSGAWSSADACNAARYLNATLATLDATRELSALAPAIERDHRDSLDAGATPNLTPICLARKPLIGSVASNVLAHGTGSINIDDCRIATEAEEFGVPQSDPAKRSGAVGSDLGISKAGVDKFQAAQRASIERTATLGRWPANLCHDGSEEVLAGFPDASGGHWPDATRTGGGDVGGGSCDYRGPGPKDEQGGSAARFFYCAKATTEERGEGNVHPTVKPIALMRWLVRLVTPKGGTVLDPFMGSGSTALACDAEQFNFIGCELSADYAAIAERRVREAAGLFAEVKAA